MVSVFNIFTGKKKETLKDNILKNLKYLIFIVLSILMIRFYPTNRLSRKEITVLVISLTGCYILLEVIAPTQKIMC
tara:strand:+ start:5735 stop:5962 length:228 start_codon:yes stop_codon:yes gene_type:complete